MEEIRRLSEMASWYMRRPNPARQAEGARRYKKGWEVRLVVRSLDDLEIVYRLLVACGFKPGRPFRKINRWIQPLYGRAAVEQFVSLVKAEGLDKESGKKA